ncbi:MULTISPECIES: hypothetical protein [Caproicibacterium]|jgi:hypothetical protein|uniref:YcxB-like protein domain-containing protein n=1 Tax=Caproicibacterium lactatifermentans TaxID=2666138 RepID=A0A859DSM5_9FIRM|nr:hypothetical protein [Caproicibacterium lactatifermentans]ARP49419.1 hypothetical protein B6259_00050 [Ruminococcaceae bacterium CPB6]MDD4807235.1 hypothetical protein [Oscillospiraceae bacterium]QKN23011.1 hypothetical protein GJQ69_00050 [Caproicibacterium lactatifermentans]QKO30383.1 hypothetical protein GKP14_04730 [Caproicibacterium lactatifermentans]
MSEKQIEEEAVKPPQPEQQDADDDGIRWDGSEARMVPDEDAQAYEEKMTAVRIRYKLTKEELCRALLREGMNRSKRFLLCGISIVSFVAAAAFLAEFSLRSLPAMLLFVVMFLVVGIFSAVFPRFAIRRFVQKNYDCQEYVLNIYPDVIEGTYGNEKISIPLDGSACSMLYKGLALLQYSEKSGSGPKKHLLVIPLRSVEPGVLADVEAMLCVGTRRVRK